MRQEKERFFQIIFEENSHVLFRYICGQLNNDRETAKDVLNDVWEVLVVKFETVADLEGEEMTKWLFCVAKNKIKNQRRKHYYQNEVSYTQYQKENRNEGEAAATAEIEERMVMQNCIQNLNPMDQRIFWGESIWIQLQRAQRILQEKRAGAAVPVQPRNQETAGNDESGNQSDESVENGNGMQRKPQLLQSKNNRNI